MSEDIEHRLREFGSNLVSHPVANSTIERTEEAGELLIQAAATIGTLRAEAEGLRRDAERYRMLRDNGYLDRLCGELHPCDDPRRMELTDAQVDRFAAMHANLAVGAA